MCHLARWCVVTFSLFFSLAVSACLLFPTRERQDSTHSSAAKRKIEATDKELKRTIKLMIARVEKRITVEPFNAVCWRASDDSITEDFSFFGDTPLDPQAPADSKRFHDIINSLRKSVTAEGEEADRMLLALDDLSYALCDHSELIGCYMGVLVGAAMMGASHDKLQAIGQGFFNHYRWDTA